MTNPFDDFFRVCRQASDAALLRSKAGNDVRAADREGNLLDQYLKAETAFMELLDACQRATRSTRVDMAIEELRQAVRENSPKRVWQIEAEEMGSEASLLYSGMGDR